MKTEQMSDADFSSYVVSILSRELTIVELARYFRLQRHCGVKDYTAERHQWLDDITLDDIARDLKLTTAE